jgi:GTP cyclohydrolase I
MISAAAKKLWNLFDLLRIDSGSDRNTRGTPRGRFEPSPTIAEFDTAPGCGQPVVAGPVAAHSTCAHHFMPIHSETGFEVLTFARGQPHREKVMTSQSTRDEFLHESLVPERSSSW